MHATETSLHGEQQWPEISTHTEKRESSEIDFFFFFFALLRDMTCLLYCLMEPRRDSAALPRAVLSWKLPGSHTHFGIAVVCCSSETWGNWFKQRGFSPSFPNLSNRLSPLGLKVLTPGREQQQGQGLPVSLTGLGAGRDGARKHLVEGGKQLDMALPCGLLGEWGNGSWRVSSCCAHGTELRLSCPPAPVVWPWGQVQTLPTNQCSCL